MGERSAFSHAPWLWFSIGVHRGSLPKARAFWCVPVMSVLVRISLFGAWRHLNFVTGSLC